MLEKLPQWDMGAFPGGLGPSGDELLSGNFNLRRMYADKCEERGMLGKILPPLPRG